ncbi:MAG: hypothetical protein DRH49_08020 [Candidatus Coatesbacteria bacterium]|nr:MAG: hypothetical protein DRH49_08020 [Candidatus Coatesbacteria bacterium]
MVRVKPSQWSDETSPEGMKEQMRIESNAIFSGLRLVKCFIFIKNTHYLWFVMEVFPYMFRDAILL